MLADYTRRGILEGVGIRLPSIVVRPGKPNKAASGFFSGIIREPLAGDEAMLPVKETVVHTHASPRAAVGFLVHAAGLDRAQARAAHQPQHAGRDLHGRRADRGAAPRRRRQGRGAHPPRAGRADRAHRRRLAAPLRSAARASALGFRAESSFDEIIRDSHRRGPGRKIAAVAQCACASPLPSSPRRWSNATSASSPTWCCRTATTITAHVANPGAMTGLAAPGVAGVAVEVGQQDPQAAAQLGADRGRFRRRPRAGRRQHRASQSAGRRGARRRRDPGACRLRQHPPRGEVRQELAGRFPARSAGAAALLCRDQERASDAQAGPRRISRRQDRARRQASRRTGRHGRGRRTAR